MGLGKPLEEGVRKIQKKYSKMTVRRALQVFLNGNPNQNAVMCVIGTDKNENSIKSILSCHVEFISNGRGEWSLDPHYEVMGWCVFGR